MAAHPYRGLSPAHTAISAKHGEPDAQEPDPGSRSTLLDYRNKEMMKTPSSARGPVNDDGIVALMKQEQFIKKNTGRDHEIKCQTLTGCCPSEKGFEQQPVKIRPQSLKVRVKDLVFYLVSDLA